MSRIDKAEVEERAAEMVVVELGAVGAEKRDVPGAPSRTHDYDIVFADGHEEPLEVTSNLDKSVMTALNRSDGGVLELEAANVQRFWMVFGNETWTDENGATKPFDRMRVEALLVPLIEQLEQEGQDAFAIDHLAWPIAFGGPHHHRRIAGELRALGIMQGSSMPSGLETRPRISVHLTSGGAWGPETITSALEEIAGLDDNIAKLEVCRAAPRRHLFVLLSSRGASDMAGWALDDFLRGWIWEAEPPLPKLPDTITTIWAGNRNGGIYSTPPEGWRRFGEAATE